MGDLYKLEDLEQLINEIKYAYQLSEKEIMKAVDYNEKYLSQTRSRKIVSEKLINALVRKFPNAKGIAPPISYDDPALLVVLIERVAKLLSRQPDGKSEMIEQELMKKDAEELRKIRGG